MVAPGLKCSGLSEHFAWFYLPLGSRCDDCASGFFGNPSDFGGSCQPCQCHHNIDTTDPEACDKETGRCLKCLYHTEGDHCQLCQYGYYGDALRQDCRSKTHTTAVLTPPPPPPPPPLIRILLLECLFHREKPLFSEAK